MSRRNSNSSRQSIIAFIQNIVNVFTFSNHQYRRDSNAEIPVTTAQLSTSFNELEVAEVIYDLDEDVITADVDYNYQSIIDIVENVDFGLTTWQNEVEINELIISELTAIEIMSTTVEEEVLEEVFEEDIEMMINPYILPNNQSRTRHSIQNHSNGNANGNYGLLNQFKPRHNPLTRRHERRHTISNLSSNRISSFNQNALIRKFSFLLLSFSCDLLN